MKFRTFFRKLIPVLLIPVLFALPVRASQLEDPGLDEDPPHIQEEQEDPEVIPVNVILSLTVSMVPDEEGAPLPGEDIFPVTVTALTEGAPGPRGRGVTKPCFGTYFPLSILYQG